MKAPIIALYADGGVIGKNPSKLGGTWAWRIVAADGQLRQENGWQSAAQLKVEQVTNNLTEMLAVVYGLEALPAGWSGTVSSDSAITLGRLFEGWKWTNIPDWLITRASAALQRLDLPNVRHILLAGHPNREQLAAGVGKNGLPVSEHNVACDTACREAAQRFHARTHGSQASAPDDRRHRARAWLIDGQIRDGYPLHDAPLEPATPGRRQTPLFVELPRRVRRQPAEAQPMLLDEAA